MTHRQRKLRRRRHRSSFERSVLYIFVPAFAAALVGLAIGLGYVVAVAVSTPDINHLTPLNKGETSYIYAADGSLLGVVQPQERRVPIAWSQMPLAVRSATVAIEDQRFYEHGGVDYQGILRALVTDVFSGRSEQGGSTITQQLVRALYMRTPQHSLGRKIREAKLATELERHHSKTWILWQYLNSVPYGTYGGRTALGVEAAAQLYFNRHASELSLPQAALLAGLPQAPTAYDPFRQPSLAIARRAEVLRAMVRQGYISAADGARAEHTPLDLVRPVTDTVSRREPYFLDYVQQELVDRYGASAFHDGGYKVYTTIDPKLQQQGRQAISSELNQPGDPSAAVVAIDPATGYIRAMASDPSASDRSFNLAAQARRQPGSAFKTFVLTTAVLEGVDPDTTVYDSKPLVLPIAGYGLWRVRTYDGSYSGPVTVTQATLRSDNTVFAQFDVDLGPKRVADTARMMGIDTPLEGVPSEGLGGLTRGVSPLEMASAYATLASGGIRSTPEAITRVVLPDGHVDQVGQPKRQRVLSAGVAYEVTHLLEQNIAAGTGTSAGYGCPAAGKTGTTDHYNDAWFVGYTSKLATAVWVGFPNALRSMNDVHGTAVTGSTIPARIWHDFMSGASLQCSDFQVPSDLPHLKSFHGPHALSGAAAAAAPSPSTLTAAPPSAATAAGAGTGGAAGTGVGAGAPAYTPAPAAAAPAPVTPSAPAPVAPSPGAGTGTRGGGGRAGAGTSGGVGGGP